MNKLNLESKSNRWTTCLRSASIRLFIKINRRRTKSPEKSKFIFLAKLLPFLISMNGFAIDSVPYIFLGYSVPNESNALFGSPGAALTAAISSSSNCWVTNIGYQCYQPSGGAYQSQFPPNAPAWSMDYMFKGSGPQIFRSGAVQNWKCPVGYGSDPFSGTCVRNGEAIPERNNPESGCGVGNPIAIGLGVKFQKEVDVSNNDSGGLRFERFYNSFFANQIKKYGFTLSPGFLGAEWQSPVTLGVGWGGTYSRHLVFSGSGFVRAYRDNMTVKVYQLQGGIWQSFHDEESTLDPILDNGVTVGWKYVNATNSNHEIYNTQGRLLSITSRGGRIQTLEYSNESTPTTIAPAPGLLIHVGDGHGRQLVLTYDSAQRLTSLTDPDGRLFSYFYDENSNLASVTFPNGDVRTYVYNEADNTAGANLPNILTGIIDENQSRFATWKYDAEGRAILSEHSGGVERVSIAYTQDANGTILQSAVTDALNTTKSYISTNILGVAKHGGVSEPCAGCESATENSYDANGNLTSRKGFSGGVTNYAYDLARNLETSRTEASGTAEERVVTTTWHPNYRLPLTITASGKVTSFNYDSSGNLLSQSVASVP